VLAITRMAEGMAAGWCVCVFLFGYVSSASLLVLAITCMAEGMAAGWYVCVCSCLGT
jgi:hypothetical protein